jgi:hypothetical protein
MDKHIAAVNEELARAFGGGSRTLELPERYQPLDIDVTVVEDDAELEHYTRWLVAA